MDASADRPTPAPARRRAPLVVAALAAAAILAGVVAALVVTAGGEADDQAGDGVIRLSSPDQAGEEAPPPDTTERAVPNLPIEYWDGRSGHLYELVGEPLVLNFFASWCAPCVKEMPAFEEVHQELGDQVRIVGVNREDRRTDADRIIEQTGITYEVVKGPDPLLERLEGTMMPTTVFITADGRVVRVHNGPIDADELRAAIDEDLLS